MLNMRMMNSIPSAALTSSPWIGSQLESFRGVSLLFLLSIDDAFNPQIIIILFAENSPTVMLLVKRYAADERHADAEFRTEY
ncbi:hypothetical protein DMB90_13440 [Raoultella planticola]|uniref:Uncharacterized protein n=1 Tax=Raoultella planticola TaxID=575 RepID=A0A5P6AA00_RAOPL|nr:hypothetical protein DMB90_13440 [Raoultella planticola]